MAKAQKRVAVIGSTGSIGRQALELLDEPAAPRLCALGAGGNWRLLAEQVRRYRPDAVAIADPAAAGPLRAELGEDFQQELLAGPDAMCELLRRCRADIVLVAVVGAAGLAPTLAAIESCHPGATLALANKEALVCAGRIVMPAARSGRLNVLPVDSEHSGIFQCIQPARRGEVRRVVITSSGGSLRDMDDIAAAEATVDQALNHPTWRMGRKITIDSATLMNKALEIIEAHWLFDLAPEQIEVVIHPQSIVHALVEFCDGSVLAQLARPDMKLPIAYALHYPDRPVRAVAPLDLAEISRLEFRPPEGRFARAVELAYRVINRGGPAGAVLNAANEAAVDAFLAGRIRFGRIVEIVSDVLDRSEDITSFLDPAAHWADEKVNLQELLAADAWARKQVSTRLSKRRETAKGREA